MSSIVADLHWGSWNIFTVAKAGRGATVENLYLNTSARSGFERTIS